MKTWEDIWTPSSPATLGPVVSAAQRNRVRSSIALGESEGARLVTGGVEPPDGLEREFLLHKAIQT